MTECAHWCRMLDAIRAEQEAENFLNGENNV